MSKFYNRMDLKSLLMGLQDLSRQSAVPAGASPSTINRYTNRDYLLSDHKLTLKREQESENIMRNNLAFTIGFQATATPTYSTSARVNLIPENQITISTLLNSIDQVLHGKFLLCRTIAPPFKMTALATIIEDMEGTLAIRLALYNYYLQDIGHVSLDKCNDVLPVGTVLAIKNPFFRCTENGGMSLRCDNPVDVIIMDEDGVQKLNPGQKWGGEIPSEYTKFMKKATIGEGEAKSLKSIGNDYFAAMQYDEAIIAYTKGLESKPSDPALLGNRAAAYIKIGKFEHALTDAEKILKADEGHKKAIGRKTKALWGLRQFKTAKEFLSVKVPSALKNDAEIHDLREKTKMLIRQSTLGEYPREIHNILYFNESSAECLEWADFEGDVIVKATPDGHGKGRGLFATKDITAGQLVLANKAFGYVPVRKNESKNRADFLFAYSSELNVHVDKEHAQLRSVLANILKQNPDKCKTLYQLYAGADMPFLDSEKRDDDSEIVDMKRIERICSYNSYGNTSPLQLNDCQHDCQHDCVVGVWIKPSFINHSCLGCNSFWTIYGDFLFVRAFKNISAGEEILIPYMSIMEPYSRRQVWLTKYGFKCECRLCDYDRQESEPCADQQLSVLKKLRALDTEIWEETGRNYFTNASLRLALPLMESVMKLRPKYQLCLLPFVKMLPFYKNQDFENALAYLKFRFEILKDTPLRAELFDVCLGILVSLMEAGKLKEAQDWVPTLRHAALTAHGNFDILYHNPASIKGWRLAGVNV